MSKKILLILLFTVIISCNKKTIKIGQDLTFEQNISIDYGNEPEQKLDLYIPQQKDSIKTIFILIHGGGWKAGRKSDLNFFVTSLMKKFRQSAIANIDYRLATETRYGIPNQLEDIKKAISYVHQKLPKNAKIILLGNSAGGHLSLLYGYQAIQNENIKAIVNIVGPSDLSDKNFKKYTDYSFVENRLVDPKVVPKNISKLNFASPIHYITEKNCPTISFYGNTDGIIPSSQKMILDSALNKKKVLNESYEFSGGHVDWKKDDNLPFILDKIDNFLKRIP